MLDLIPRLAHNGVAATRFRIEMNYPKGHGSNNVLATTTACLDSAMRATALARLSLSLVGTTVEVDMDLIGDSVHPITILQSLRPWLPKGVAACTVRGYD